MTQLKFTLITVAPIIFIWCIHMMYTDNSIDVTEYMKFPETRLGLLGIAGFMTSFYVLFYLLLVKYENFVPTHERFSSKLIILIFSFIVAVIVLGLLSAFILVGTSSSFNIHVFIDFVVPLSLMVNVLIIKYNKRKYED